MDFTLLLAITLGAVLGILSRMALGSVSDARRTMQELRDADTDLLRRLTALSEKLRALAERLNTAPPASQAFADVVDRLERVEAKHLAMHLDVMDRAEKVTHRLKDRERKRTDRETEVDDDADSPGDLLAAARAQYPLPGFPGDVPVVGDER